MNTRAPEAPRMPSGSWSVTATMRSFLSRGTTEKAAITGGWGAFFRAPERSPAPPSSAGTGFDSGAAGDGTRSA